MFMETLKRHIKYELEGYFKIENKLKIYFKTFAFLRETKVFRAFQECKVSQTQNICGRMQTR